MIELAMELLRQEEFKRQGANKNEINRIKRMHAGGMSPEQISDKLNICLSSIRSYLPPIVGDIAPTVTPPPAAEEQPRKSARRS